MVIEVALCGIIVVMKVKENHRCDPSHFLDCQICGNKFHRSPHWKTRQNYFCSNDCRIIHLNTLPKWNKGNITKQITKKGYIRLHWDGKRYVMEHRLVAELILDRQLNEVEVIHHVDRNKTNNSPDNLMLFPNQAAHLALHALENKIGFKVFRGEIPTLDERNDLEAMRGKLLSEYLDLMTDDEQSKELSDRLRFLRSLKIAHQNEYLLGENP